METLADGAAGFSAATPMTLVLQVPTPTFATPKKVTAKVRAHKGKEREPRGALSPPPRQVHGAAGLSAPTPMTLVLHTMESTFATPAKITAKVRAQLQQGKERVPPSTAVSPLLVLAGAHRCA